MYGENIDINVIRKNSLNMYKDRPLLRQKNKEVISTFSAFNILVNLVCSSDPFFIYESLDCGILGFVIIASLICFLTIVSFDIFKQNWQFGTEFSFPDIWGRLINHNTSWVPRVVVFFCYFSMFVSCSWELYEDGSALLQDFLPSLPDWTTDIMFFGYMAMIVLIVITIGFTALYQHSIYSYISNACLVIYTVILGYLAIDFVIENGWDPEGRISLFNFDHKVIHMAFNSLIPCFLTHPMAFHVIKHVENPTMRNSTNLIFWTMLVTYFFNVACGIFGCIISPALDTNALLAYEGTAPFWLVVTGRIAGYIRSFCTTSCYLFLVSYELVELIYKGGSKCNMGTKLTMMVMALVIQVFNVGSDNFYTIFEIIGSFSSILLTFELPSIYYIIGNGLRCNYESIASVAEIIIGLAFLVYIIL